MNRKELSIQLIRWSILLYVIWLLLPAVQTTGRAVSGCACVGLFGLGILLDTQTLKTQWKHLLCRAAAAAAMPLLARLFMDRGGTHFAGFYVQHAMFWFPLAFAGHVRTLGDRRLWKHLKWALGGAIILTLLTTAFWLVEGMFLRGDKIYAYSRSLGFAEPGNEAYLKELMLKNIGGYDFIYAMVAALPLACIAIQQTKGAKRAAFLALILLQTAVIVLSQYTYAMIYAATILAVEVLAFFIRRLSKGRVGMGASLLLGAVPLLLAALFMQPLSQLASAVCSKLGLVNFAFSFEQLALALQGSATDANSRLSHYLVAWEGFRSSPFFGTRGMLSYHSDLLDLLSGAGILGFALVLIVIPLQIGRGSLRGFRASPHRAQLCLMFAAVCVTAALGTVVYSRDVMAVCALGTLLVLEE